jgi:hypothetical protein
MMRWGLRFFRGFLFHDLECVERLVPLPLIAGFVEFQKRERRYGGIREGQPSTEKPARVAGE